MKYNHASTRTIIARDFSRLKARQVAEFLRVGGIGAISKRAMEQPRSAINTCEIERGETINEILRAGPPVRSSVGRDTVPGRPGRLRRYERGEHRWVW